MFLRRLLRTAFVLSVPFGLGGLALVFLGWAGLTQALAVWALGTAGLVLLLYRPIKDLDGVVSYFSSLEEVPDAPPPELTGPMWGESFAQILNGTSRLVRRYSAAGRQIQAELDLLIDKIPMPLLQVDSQRRVVRHNRAAAGLAGDSALGRDLVLSIRHPELIAAVDQVLVSHESAHIELSLGSPNEQTFLCHVVASDPKVEHDAILIVFSDITEVVRGERMRVDFVANASHEIRSPLATLAGCIETLQGPAKDDPEGQDKFLHLASVEAKRMTTLVSDLLSLSQIEVNQHIAPADPVDMVSVLRRVVSGLTVGQEGQGVEIDFDVPDDLPTVIGDDSELQQVFQNLLANAARYGGPKIQVFAEKIEGMPAPGLKGAAVRFQVRDWGPGIDPIHLPRLTERFYRVDTVRSRELGGTGLGLAITKHVVNRHRGVLEISSEVGQGSTFSVYLPTAE
ncbi:MAG: PAS domain-containing protein [Alphaproteobacteria bacterium]|nr:PAS domain-containing protein [Alphaproteobacteria bacterium]